MVVKNKRKQTFKYIISDYLSALVTWVSFYFFRKFVLEGFPNFSSINIYSDGAFFQGVILIPLFWILLYYLAGEYKDVYHRTYLKELGNTLFLVTLGVIVIFFVLILDDIIIDYKNYYQSFAYLWITHFFLTYIFRLRITRANTKRIRNNLIGFPAIIVGSNQQAEKLYHQIIKHQSAIGTQLIGFVTVNGDQQSHLNKYLPYLGTIQELIPIIQDNDVEEVLIAIESSERQKLQQILTQAKSLDVMVKAIPDLLDILSGQVKMPSIYNVPLLDLSHQHLPAWQENVKRLIDVLISIICLILLLPAALVIAVMVKRSSKGPVFYTHERLGRYGKPFNIYKFRTMYVDAEKDGPALSGANDPRITPIGKKLRKVRLDELPQFFNVLIGEMSLVGPRPERQYYVDKIVKIAPHYLGLFKVRPGITSWGQVQYGYAENVDQMVERLNYDLIYLENMSLYADIKILIYTIRTVIQGKGQ